MSIAIINGPNLNLIGKRQPEIYGNRSLDDYLGEFPGKFPGTDFILFQSNSEGAIVSAIQRYGFDPQVSGIIINPGAYAHYSQAIADAIRSIPTPVIEVHISNIHAREEFRSVSVTAAASRSMLCGFGLPGYDLAVNAILSHKNPE